MIHGSKKVKKQKTQVQIKEQQQLSNKINSKLSDFFLIRNKPYTQDQIPKYIQFTSLLMQLCSDIPTIFNFRRQLLQKVLFSCQKQQKKQQYLMNEIKLVTKLIQQDPKSYTLWSFRQWLVQNIYKVNKIIVKEEKKLCKMLLMKDQKNFHVWNYRNWVNSVQFNIDQELAFTQQKIKSNPFNFSPYHFRSKYLPLKYQAILNKYTSSNQQTQQSIKIIEQILKYGMTKQLFDSQLQSIKTAIYLNPNQQAPWSYYRWLLKRLLPVIVLKQQKNTNVIKIFLNQRVKNVQNILKKINNDSAKIINKSNLSNVWQIQSNNDQIIKGFYNNNSLIQTQAISKHFIGQLTTDNISQIQQIRTIFKQQQTFLRQILQQQQKCRFAWLQLLQILKNKLSLTCTSQKWKTITQSGMKAFQHLDQEKKTRHYIQRLREYWFRIGNIDNLNEEQKLLIRQN